MLNILKRLLILLIVVPIAGIIAGMMAGPWTGLMTMLVTVSGIRWKNRPGQENTGHKLTLSDVHIPNPGQPEQAFNLAPEESSSRVPVIEARFQVDSTEIREIIIEPDRSSRKSAGAPPDTLGTKPCRLRCQGT